MTKNNNLKIDILLLSKEWLQENKIKKYCNNIWSIINYIFTEFISYNFQLSVLLTNDAFIKQLNYKWRGINNPTNILSFPINNNIKIKKFILGDIVLSYQTIYKESYQNKISFKNHLLHLLVHGILHLLGYTHNYINDSLLMESLEINILSFLNIYNPYV